jgi:endonuclease/exonuclease/phosphatase (EEP) superfamily protein YafD
MPSLSLRRHLLRGLAVAAWLTSVLLAVVALLRVAAHDRTHALVLVNMFTMYVYLPAYAVLVFAAIVRRWRLLGLAAFVVTMHLWWVLPGALWASALPDVAGAPHLRVMSANLLVDNPRKDELVREILESEADVLLLQELSTEWREALLRSEVAVKYPHHVEKIRDWPFGIGIYSRLPLEDANVVDVADFPMIHVAVRVGGEVVHVYDVHTLTPRFPEWVAPWNEQLQAALTAAQSRQEAVIVAGDFNLTPHGAWYGRYRAAGLREAHDERGRGLATTWPNGALSLPEVRLDHAFLRGDVVCTAIREGRGAGSDHRPVIFDVALVAR